jgi:hypothetical protein
MSSLQRGHAGNFFKAFFPPTHEAFHYDFFSTPFTKVLPNFSLFP